MESFKSLNDYFQVKLQKLECEEELKAYIVSIFAKYKSANTDLSKHSVTIEFSLAKFDRDFAKFQNIGDWLFFTNTLYPESLSHASKSYYHSVGQMSYYSCYTIVKNWKLYEQMADRFVYLSDTTRSIIRR
jgi:hypothetical protein